MPKYNNIRSSRDLNMHIYPVYLITSLVTLIFLVHPKHKSSSEQKSFFSTSGGFLLVVVCENMIGVVALRLRLLDRDTEGIFSVF
ncbi:hypothetical protein Lalb_Chr09g0332841 [Lupinus albus]|uniref:Uncharacterized protein n=1 Tax=Lupinus albus TaxID=3870 RepID=A0A6A4Q2G3_LUPAL|nr:hypothetical protein Lalb_Chr09g0332841 [Lupinus albus]